MTSFPQAIPYAIGAIRSILNGAVLPDKLILYLTFSQFGDAGVPDALQQLADGSTVIIYADAKPSAETETMPDLSNMSYDEAKETLGSYGLFIKTSSAITNPETQRISSQSVKKGASVKHGTIVEVTFVSSDDSILGRY